MPGVDSGPTNHPLFRGDCLKHVFPSSYKNILQCAQGLKMVMVDSMGQRNTYPRDEQTGGGNGPDGKTWSIGFGKKRTVAKVASRGITQ